jgi:GNAT superfamily N-acetyltransferase
MPMQQTSSGVPYEAAALDAVEQRFWRGIWGAVPAEVADERGIDAQGFGPVQATIVTALPDARMLNLILGASEPGAAGDGHLDRALDWADSHGVSPYVPLTGTGPGAEESEQLLRSRGYERGYAWMKFVRDAHPPRFAGPAGVDVVRVEESDESFAMIAATGFGLPAWAADFFAELHRRPGWHCYTARVNDEPAACAAMFVADGVAEFGIAATLEPARGRGCQLALLHRRIADAAAAGCHTLFVETGERVPQRPSASYRNILRAGFEEAYLRPNWTTGSHPPRRKAPTGIEPV